MKPISSATLLLKRCAVGWQPSKMMARTTAGYHSPSIGPRSSSVLTATKALS